MIFGVELGAYISVFASLVFFFFLAILVSERSILKLMLMLHIDWRMENRIKILCIASV